MKCPYCMSSVDLKDSSVVYGRSYGLIYICSKFPECDAYVGVHRGTKIPLGRLADRTLRYWKKAAHAAFDPLWKNKVIKRNNGRNNRSSSYLWLSQSLGIPEDKCHIGMFDVEQCKMVVDICRSRLKELAA